MKNEEEIDYQSECDAAKAELAKTADELTEVKAELDKAKETIKKQSEAINKLINSMATRYAQDLYKEILPND